jgi:hypothetical protein
LSALLERSVFLVGLWCQRADPVVATWREVADPSGPTITYHSDGTDKGELL